MVHTVALMQQDKKVRRASMLNVSLVWDPMSCQRMVHPARRAAGAHAVSCRRARGTQAGAHWQPGIPWVDSATTLLALSA
jgi:hypothetical protein